MTCSRNADVIFVVDSSVDESSFDISKQLIIDILSRVNVSQDATRVSIVQFGTSARIAVQLTDIDNHQELFDNVVPLMITSGSRNLAIAIQLALQEIEESGRVGVTRLMYIITSGQSDNLEASIVAAQSAKDNDILIFGIGNDAARTELEEIVSPNLLFITDNLNSQVLRQSSIDAICNQGMGSWCDIIIHFLSSNLC